MLFVNIQQTSPVDKIYLGVLPTVFEAEISKFLQLSSKPQMEKLRGELLTNWTNVKNLI